MRLLRILVLALVLPCWKGAFAHGQFQITLPGVRLGLGRNTPTLAQALLQEKIQRDLALSAKQKAQLQQIARKVQDTFKARHIRLLAQLSQQLDQRAALERKQHTEARKAMSTFLIPSQEQRLQQIERQRQGPAAFSDPLIQKQLGLTMEQKKQIQGILKTGEKDLLQWLSKALAGGQPASTLPARFAEQRNKTETKLLKELTAGQKKRWQELVGKPFAWQSLSFPTNLTSGAIPVTTPEEVLSLLDRELRLTSTQVLQISKMAREVEKAFADKDKTLANKIAQLKEQEQTLRSKMDKQLTPQLLGVLSSKQRQRAEQIRRQLLGLAVWSDPVVQKELGLSEKQKRAISGIQERTRDSVPILLAQIRREARRKADGNPTKRTQLMKAKIAAAYRAVQQQILDELTEPQRKKWRASIGAPIAIDVSFELPR